MKDPRALKATQALMTTADETEASFYDAMRHGDVDKVMACWADDEEIACVSPGGPRTVGTVAVRAAFAATLATGPVHITIEHVRSMESAVCAVHHVTEKVQVMSTEGLQTAFVIATNVYLRTPQGWRMVAHHASAGMPQDLPDISEPRSTLH
ncbi:MAG: nuclear transport factor 2 family protein [Aquabacterium sp.]|jgi:ketosteroid isomerase-like protein|uniref:YybH family protein n=1 Tax=Aquabacterium sp. TaxID=1872578 RepID=UPI002A35BC4D|nr:nuclear transport factor 2 family protein [Aquabacterium sp.]MDX9842535.1 nuclear transport factor 2 family protein [Aquabacterium sp.]